MEAEFDHRQKATVACEFQVCLRLDKHSAHLNVRVEMDNAARDHRIRFLFPLTQKAVQVWAGAQFDVVQRPWNEGLEWNRDCNAQPYWKWLSSSYDNGGLAIFSKGLFEYEMLEEGSQVAITLLRCVENINMREPIPLENDIQPKGQCIGKHVFELAVRPFVDESATQLYQEAELFNQGLKTKLSAVEDSRWTQGRAWVQTTKLSASFVRPDPNENKERLPMSNEWIRLEGNAIVSAVKWAEDGQGLVIRIFNAESNVSLVRLKPVKQPIRAVYTNLIEENQSEMKITNQALDFELYPKKIKTIKLYL